MFWDSSALVPIFLKEERSGELTGLLASDPQPLVWWATPVECHSAFQRRHRRATIPPATLQEALGRFDEIGRARGQVSPDEPVRRRAIRLLAVHGLRAADALQLAAALFWCEESPEGQQFVCLDDRLRDAARAEGFDVRP
jgi:Predicted nucleic acid-binding protein, contains PIN domain